LRGVGGKKRGRTDLTVVNPWGEEKHLCKEDNGADERDHISKKDARSPKGDGSLPKQEKKKEVLKRKWGRVAGDMGEGVQSIHIGERHMLLKDRTR